MQIVTQDESRLELVRSPLEAQQLAWAVRQGDDELRGQANAALARWRANGWLEQTLNSWMPYLQALAAAPAK